ncbi:MAG: class I SAM-dependent methyltransferase [Saprospiraceae bacterium]|nr:class I SAM-dependent methyltransferase [Saprospiraceae bacterium]
MDDTLFYSIPPLLKTLEQECKDIGFTMPSDRHIGALLRTMVSSKPGGHFLELGTGIGLSLCWMIEGMDQGSHLFSIDNDPQLSKIAQGHFGADSRVEIICQDGGEWIKAYDGPGFDLIFADAWPGKYFDLKETLDLIKPGGFYVIDDMLPEVDWPEGHAEKATALIKYLEEHPQLHVTKMSWSTGIIVATKIADAPPSS